VIDLHTHSTASDGSFSPAALMAEAARRGLTAIALTDHDTIAGLAEAGRAALELCIRFVPGVELEIEWNQGGEFHLLGLGVTRPTPAFIAALEDLSRARHGRNVEMVERMNAAGIEFSYDDVTSLAAGHGNAGANAGSAGSISIGRPHFADFLAKRKIVKNREQAFIRYLGKGKPFYIPKAGLEFERAAAAIHESGGIAVLAHPMSLYTAWGRLPGLIASLKERGLDGLEAWHPNVTLSSCRRLEELGRKLGLHVTAGSDFHGAARPDRRLGVTAGGRKIDETFLDITALFG